MKLTHKQIQKIKKLIRIKHLLDRQRVLRRCKAKADAMLKAIPSPSRHAH